MSPGPLPLDVPHGPSGAPGEQGATLLLLLVALVATVGWRRRAAGEPGRRGLPATSRFLERLPRDRPTLARVARERLALEHAFLGLVVVVWLALYVHGLGDHPLRVWDESRYADPARHMLRRGDWLVPRIQANTHADVVELSPRLNKPPLTYWLQATAMLAFGATTFAARLPAALATLGCALLVYHVGRTAFDRRVALTGALVFLVFPGVLLGSHGGRAAVTDLPLALVGSLFVWFTWRGRERPRLLALGGVAAGLAVMTKGFAAGVFVVVVAPLLLSSCRSYLTRWTGGAVAITAAIALPWHLYVWRRFGDAFVHQYYRVPVVQRVDGEMSAGPAEPTFEFMNYPYFKLVGELVAPPYPQALPLFGTALVGGFVLVARRLRRDGLEAHRLEVVLAWWTVAVPLTFALGGGNHLWYLIPMYVPGAVLVGSALVAAADGLADRLRGRLPAADRASYVAVGVCLLLVLPATYAPVTTHEYDVEQRALGTAVDDEVPAETAIHVWLGDGETDVDRRRALMSLSFYADRPYERASLEQVRSDPGIRYAIVPASARARVDRPHRVVDVGEANDVAVVAFDRPGPASTPS